MGAGSGAWEALRDTCESMAAALEVPGEPTGALAAWCALDDLVRTLRILMAECERVMLGSGLRVIEIPDAVAERMPDRQRKSWDHERLARAVVARDGADPVGVILRTAAISYWRVGELRRLGIEADAFCEVERGTPRVKVTRRPSGVGDDDGEGVVHHGGVRLDEALDVDHPAQPGPPVG